MSENLPQQTEEISLKDLLLKIQEWYHYLLGKWKIIVLAGIVGGLLGLAYSFTKKPVYTASLTFALEDEKSGGISGLGALAGSFGFDVGGGGGSIFSGANLNELFRSRAMVQRALLQEVTYQGKKMSLIEMYFQYKEIREKWSENDAFKNIQFLPKSDPNKFTRQQDSIITSVYGDIFNNVLSVSQKDKKINITTLEVKSTNELFAKYFNEQLAKVVSDFYVSTKSKKARENMLILERQTDSIRRELNAAITGVAVANDNTFNLNPALNVRRAPSARRQVDVQANTAILSELIKQMEVAKVTLRKETPLIQVVDRPILPLPKERLGKTKAFLIGGILVGIFTIVFLICKRLIRLFSA
ncbi:Wzz/FepE/Etk N-terminal domain-containing protein [Flavobacterium agrisoli]|uniref:Lipopolysaccharide biosynthesis protein n=1 Tax=Flavobacterium agrisoli TaxID=2793066 RepID=A0A934PQ38_9FLAO|nr:Wzz/FepE/Etk N-terminal domain-containing protein [Flavobacterium agrisoli]MBK0371275.1 lipopolysaccharide biosynthesis protein [Flavobacterium agrisoli]